MKDQFCGYKERVRKLLKRDENNPIMRVAEVLCFPSFHPETLLRAVLDPVGTSFRLCTLDSSLWYCDESEGGPQPERFQEVCGVSTESAMRFWDAIDELHPETIGEEQRFGCDGIS